MGNSPIPILIINPDPPLPVALHPRPPPLSPFDTFASDPVPSIPHSRSIFRDRLPVALAVPFIPISDPPPIFPSPLILPFLKPSDLRPSDPRFSLFLPLSPFWILTYFLPPHRTHLIFILSLYRALSPTLSSIWHNRRNCANSILPCPLRGGGKTDSRGRGEIHIRQWGKIRITKPHYLMWKREKRGKKGKKVFFPKI